MSKKNKQKSASIPPGAAAAAAKAVIATSIAPFDFEKQKTAIATWTAIGFKVVSLNCPEEIPVVRPHFPDVTFVPVERDARLLAGKPLVYFDDVLGYFSTAGCEVCGIVNSDVSLKATKKLIPFLQAETKNSLVTGCRVDVSEDQENGVLYPMGLDYFFFDRSVIKSYPKDSFIIGAPWWDYWAAFVPLTQGITVKQLIPPIGYHPEHTYKWDQELWHSLANRVYEYLYRSSIQLTFDQNLIETHGIHFAVAYGVMQHIHDHAVPVSFGPGTCGKAGRAASADYDLLQHPPREARTPEDFARFNITKTYLLTCIEQCPGFPGISATLHALYGKTSGAFAAPKPGKTDRQGRSADIPAPVQGAIVIDGVVFEIQQDRQSGISRVWTSLLRYFSGTGLRDKIILLDRNSTAPFVPGIRTLKIDGYTLGSFETDSLYLQSVLDSLDAGLFISTYQTYPETSPCLLMLYDMTPEVLGFDLQDVQWRAKAKAIEKAFAYVAISEATKNDFRKIYPRHADKPVFVMPLAASGEFRPNSEKEILQFRRKYGISKPYFLLTGKRSGYKNAVLFFRAFSQLEKKGEYEVFCAGGAPELEEYLRPYLDGSACQVRFLTDRELSVAYSGATALVYPSLNEGFGLPVLEAMKSGCPVIACNNSSVPEIGGDAVCYVDEHDAAELKEALQRVQDPAFRSGLISRGLENVKRFSWEKTGAIITEVITRQLPHIKDLPSNETDPLDTSMRFIHAMLAQPSQSSLADALIESMGLIAHDAPHDDPRFAKEENVIKTMDAAAFNLLAEACSRGTHDGWLRYWHGLALEGRGFAEKALGEYQLALSYGLNKGRILYLAAQLALRLNKALTAYSFFSSLHGLAPRSKEILTAAQTLSREIDATHSETILRTASVPENLRPPDAAVHQGTLPKVSLVLPTIGRMQELEETLRSVPPAMQDVPYEILLYIGGEVTDALRGIIRDYGIERVFHDRDIFRPAGKFSWAKLMRHGFQQAAGGWIAYASDDIVFYPYAFQNALLMTDDERDLGGITFLHRNTVDDFGGKYRQFGYDAFDNKTFINFGIIKKDAYEKTKGFDERFQFYWADVDICMQLWQAGFRLKASLLSLVDHNNISDQRRSDNSRDTYFADSKCYLEKWSGNPLFQSKNVLDRERFVLEGNDAQKVLDVIHSQSGVRQELPATGADAQAPEESGTRTAGDGKPSVKVSAIVSAYNSERFIRGCLEDLVNQTLYRKGELEIIVVDSGSEQNEEAVVKEFQKTHPHIHYMKTENRETVYEAWNRGIKTAAGEYITNANTDDRHREDAFAIMAKELDEHPETALVYADSIITKKENETFDRCTPAGYFALPEYDRIHLLHGSCIGPHPMWRKKLHDELGYFDGTLKVAGDYEWWLRISEKYPFRHVPELLGLYLIAPRSVEHSNEQTSSAEAFSVRDRYAKKAGISHDFARYGKPFVVRQYPPEKPGDAADGTPVPAAGQKRPAFAAVYCVYDDTTWLRESIESVYPAVDALFFLVSDRPWFGQATDNKTTLEYIRSFPDQDQKITLIQGNWTNETDQRNKGLGILQEKGFDYCVVVDADEIYDPMELKRMTELAALHPEVDCWHVSLDTYWKSYRYRIDPREPLQPPVMVKVGGARFTRNRAAEGKTHQPVPPEIGICHHLSYARSDAEVLKKISTFSHAHEVRPGWFAKIWKRWDADHSLTDLHPTHPHNYQRAVDQPYAAMPPVLRTRYLTDEKNAREVFPGLTSIIILAHNQWDQTERCLESIGRNTPEPHEIIVVDNNSADGTRTRLQTLLKTIPRLKVISNNTNRGYAAGNNQGISIARGEYVLLLNNDTVVTPGWLRRMTDIFRRFPKTGVAGPMSNTVTRPQLAENADYVNNGGIDGFAEKWAKDHDGQSFTTTKASGFCLLARRDVIDTIGGLDEQFGSGNFEDDDFCSRAFLTGFEIRIVQDVFIHHEGSQTFKGAGIDYNAKMLRNWELYKAKWDIPKDTPLDRYWIPSRLPETVSHFFPLPDLSADHTVDPETRWWEDFRKKEEQKEEKAMKKERSKGLTSLIVLLSGHSGYARTCVESIQRHTKEPHEILFVPTDASHEPPKWLRKMLKENKNYRLVIPPNPPLEKGGTVFDPALTNGKTSFAPPLDKRGTEAENDSAIKKISPTLEKGGKGGFSDGQNKSLTYALACNRGLAEAKGEYLVVLRDTLAVTEEWLSGMIGHLNNSPGTGIVGPMTVNVEGRQNLLRVDASLIKYDFESSIEQVIPPNPPLEKGGTVFDLSLEKGRTDAGNNSAIKKISPTLEKGGKGGFSDEYIDAYAKSFRERNRYRRVPVKNLDSFCLLFTHALTEKIGPFDEQFETDEYAADDYCIRAVMEGNENVIAGDVFIHYYGIPALPALKDRIAFGKKWADADKATPASKKAYCANALLLSDELNQKGRKEKAVSTLIEAIQTYPEERRLGYALAEILIGEKKYKEALELAEQMPPGSTPDEKRLELLGACTLYLGRNEEADRYADELLLQNKASAKAWNLKGTAAFEKKAYADAERSFQQAISSDRSFGEPYANIGALRWAGGKKEEALQLFERAFILSPVTEDILTNYYTAAVSLSLLPAAEKLFREAISLYPFNRRLKFVLIDNLLQQGKYAGAMDEMEEALAVFGVDDNTLAVALKLRERIQQGPRSRGVEDSSGIQKTKYSTPGTLESLTTVSLCMIVKNEEKNIIRALQSAKPLVDEMIVVDTGSADRTKKIAKAFGAKVYDFPWTDSFSDARNFSLSKATGNWILVLDADEVISPADHDTLKQLIQQDSRIQGVKDSSEASSLIPHPSSLPAYSFVTRNYVGPVSANWHANEGTYREEAGSGWFPSGKVRLFPNDSRIRFEKPVHEVVEDSLLRAGYRIVKSDIPIHHYGKLNTEEIRSKGEEYYQLGKKKLAEQGAEDPKALYELAVQASELEKYDEALELWQKLIAAKPGFGKAYYGMGTSYYKLGRYGEARAAYKKAVEITPGSKDPVVMYATSELIAGDAGAAVSLLDGLLRKDPGYPLALLASAAAHFCAGRKKEGLAYARKVQETQFDLAPYLTDIANILISVKRFDCAARLLEAAIETGNTTDEIRQLMEEIQQDSKGEGSRIPGSKDSSETLKKKLLTPLPLDPSPSFVETTRTLESSNPGTLSLCMIVKDEEDSIAQALLSVKPVAGEMVVVDTGSTDRTKEIAAGLGAKVYDFPWTNSFSDARNFSLSKATGDWILVLDADEVISPLDHEKLKQLLRTDSRVPGFKDSGEASSFIPHPSSLPAYSFVTRTYVAEMNTAGWVANDGRYRNEEAGTGWFPGEKVRLFPNDSRIRFEYALHERVEPSLIQAGFEIRSCDIPVHHYGNFVTSKKGRSKAEQYYQLGQKKIADSGRQNFMAFYELALQGAELGKHEEAIEYLKKTLELKPDFAKAHQSMGNAHYNLGRYGEALPFYRKALALDPGSRDAVMMCATCEIYAGNAAKAAGLLEGFPGAEGPSPQMLLLLAEAHVCAGRKKQGLEYVKKLRELKLDAGGLFNNFAKILMSAGRRDYALSILDAAVEDGFATEETRELIRKNFPLK